MASEETRQLQEQINRLIQDYLSYEKEIGVSQELRNQREQEFKDKLAAAGENQAQLNALSAELNTELDKSRKYAQELGDDFNYVRGSLDDIVDDLGTSGDLGRQVLKSFRGIRDLTTKIRDDRDLTNALDSKGLEKIKEKLAVEQAQLSAQVMRGAEQLKINNLTGENAVEAEKVIQALKRGENISEDQLEILRNQEGVFEGMSAQDKARFLSAVDFGKVVVDTENNTTKLSEKFKIINDELEKSIAREKTLNKTIGVTGEIIKGLSKVPGLSAVFKAEDIEAVKQELRETGEEGNRSLAMSKMLQKSFGNLKNALTDPAAIFTAITTALLKNSQLTNQFQSELGVSYGSALAMRNELNNAAAASGDLFINSEKLQKSFFALKETTGVFFDLSSQSAETFTNLTERIGLAGQEAGNLTMLMRLQGKETEATLENMYDTTGAMLQTSKTTASVKDILGDVAKSSKGLQASLASNPQALAKAAIAARELGATLADMEKVQGALLDFEQSIGAELEAELLTGKQLNLEKARLAALNNDMVALGEELKKQNVDLASFGDMNVKQQEAIAKAMGMNRNEMGEMLLKQEMQNKSLDEIRSTMGEQAYEQAKALSAQDKFNAATAKLKDLFGSVMTALTPIIDVLAMMLEPIGFVAKLLGKLNELTGGFSNGLIGVAIAAKALGVRFGAMFNPQTYIGFFKGLFDRIRGISFSGIGDKLKGAFAPGSTDGFFKGIKDRIKGLSEPLKGLKDKLMGAFSGAADKAKGIQFDPRMAGGGRFRDMATGRMVSEETANAAGVFKPGTGPSAAAAGATDAAGPAATPAPKDNGKALKEKMQNIAEGIKSFADPKVLLGGLYMIASAPGLIALGVASLPLKIVEKLNGPKLMASMQGIASGVASFASASAGILPLIGAAGALAILTLGLPGLAGIALLGAPAAAGLTALTGGLMALGTAAATGVPFLGAALLGAFGVALIPFGAALGLAAPAIEAVGTVIATTIMAIADAVVTVMPALTQGLIDLATQVPIANLLALGLALPGVAMGVGILGGALLLSAPGFIIGSFTLPLIGPALVQLGEALAGIDTAAFFQFGIGMAALTAAFTLAGLAYPLIIGGSLALSVALIPLTAALQAAAPAMLIFGSALTTLSNVDYSNLLQLAIALPALALGIGSLALSMGAAVIAAVSLKIITSALEPLAEIAPKLNLTDETLKNIATSARTLAESLSGINVSPLILLSQIGEKVSNLKDTFASIGEGIASMGSVMKDKLLNAGEGIKNFFGGLKDKFTIVGEAAKGKFAEIKEKLSPTVKADYTPRPEQAGVSGDMSGAISGTVRAAVVEVLREKLPNGEFKVTTTLQNLDTGETTTDSAVSPKLDVAERKAELGGRANLVTGTNITPSAPGFQPVAPPNVGAGPGAPGAPIVQQGVTAEEIEGIVASTIKALVPEMVAAMGNVKVVNDNFHNSKQSEGPSRNRQITNNNFA